MPSKRNSGKKKSPKNKTARKMSAKSRAGSGKKVAKTQTADNASRFAPPASEIQAGDLQGLSDVERADSESVDELLEEGNAFEAGVVQGVEEADDAETREVHTHEVPEDDVPEEYLDKD